MGHAVGAGYAGNGDIAHYDSLANGTQSTERKNLSLANPDYYDEDGKLDLDLLPEGRCGSRRWGWLRRQWRYSPLR